VGIKQWNVSRPREDEVAALAAQTGLSTLLARVLCARGQGSRERVDALFVEETTLSDPYRIKDMDKAVARIRQAVENSERIAVFGDYDCDGITATALMTGYLQAVGANVIYSVPVRDLDGYGLNMAAVDFLHSQKVDLILTVDNGISSHKEIEYAAGLGMDTVVTDHHTPQATLPDAAAVINPHRADCQSGLTELSGVGVAFKLVCALEDDLTGDEMLEYYADLAMIGSVADVVPLLGENRVIVRRGLAQLAQSDRVGLSALIERVGLSGKALTTEAIAFNIIPRLNAVGRMGPVDDAIELLLTDDYPYAWDISERMEDLNEQRKSIEQAVFREIEDKLAANPSLLQERLLILAGKGWHHGVVGIVSSRVMEKTGKPCILFSLDETEARGSARSFCGFSMIEAVTACSAHLSRYGGHTLAAGMSVPIEHYQAFADQMQAYARTHHPFMPALPIEVDCPLKPSELSVENIRTLAAMEPYGAGNKAPCFLIERLTVDRITPISEGKHIRISLIGESTSFSALYFRRRAGDFPYQRGDMVDLVASVTLSNYAGKTQLSVIVCDMRPSGVDQTTAIREGQAYACFLRGEQGPAEEVDLLPTREDIALVYRTLRGAGCYRHSAAELYYHLRESGIGHAKVLAAVDILIEMKLVEAGEKGGLTCLPNPPKVDLEESELLNRLKALNPIHNEHP